MYKPVVTKMCQDVFWVGVNDWAIRIFHGYHTDEGSSYNAYLIMDEHPTIIDTVKCPFSTEMLERVQGICPLENIEYVVMNHAEGDHSSALPVVITKLPKATIVCNVKCKDTLQTLYPSLKDHQKWQVVDGKSELCIGVRTLRFVLIPMVHWPESMVTYSEYDKILFSNDGFGQHLASAERWADEVPEYKWLSLMKEYNANILGHIPNLIKGVVGVVSTIKIDVILPAHGVAFRGNSIKTAFGEYDRFGNQRYEKKVTIIFDSMYGTTGRIAVAIAEGVKDAGAKVEVIDMKSCDLTKVALHMYDSNVFAFGSPTLNATMMPLVEGAIGYLRGLKLLSGKTGAVFGAYGWAGRSIPDMVEAIKRCNASIIDEKGLTWKFQVDEKVMADAFKLGQALGQKAMQ